VWHVCVVISLMCVDVMCYVCSVFCVRCVCCDVVTYARVCDVLCGVCEPVHMYTARGTYHWVPQKHKFQINQLLLQKVR
jgi:hypothetical protein